MWAPRRWVQLAVSNLSLLMNNHSILRVYGFCEFCNFQVETRYRSRALPRQRGAGEEAVVETRAAVRLERVSTRQIIPAMPHERSGPSLGNLKIRDLEILVIFGIRDVPCHSHALPRQRHACKEAGCESRARGRVFRTRFHMPNHARVAPRPLRSKFGGNENSRFRNFRSEIWTAFALP